MPVGTLPWAATNEFKILQYRVLRSQSKHHGRRWMSHSQYNVTPGGLYLDPIAEAVATESRFRREVAQLTLSLEGIQKLEKGSKRSTKNESSQIWFSLEELEGLPLSLQAKLAKGEPKTPHEGKLALSHQITSSADIIKYLVKPAVHKRLFIWNENRNNGIAPIMNEIIEARTEFARIGGAITYFDCSPKRSLMHSQSVNSFIDETKRLVEASITK